MMCDNNYIAKRKQFLKGQTGKI